jgi:PAS domain S-box-containing protein
MMQASQATTGDGREPTAESSSPFFGIAPDPLCLLDSRGRVREVNAAFSRLLGYGAPEVGGVAFLEWVHPQDRKTCVAVLGSAVANQQLETFQARLRDQAGDYVAMVWHVTSQTGQLYLAGQVEAGGPAGPADETERQAAKLEAAAEISVATALTLEIDRLLQEVVDVTRKRFDLAYTRAYLLNATGDELELAASAGATGQQMAATGERIALDDPRSPIAEAARSRRGVTANDLQASDAAGDGWLAEAGALLAVPLLAGTQLVGALALADGTAGRFDKLDVDIFTALAMQVAVAVENARSYAQAEAAVAETNALMRRLTREGWEGYLREQLPLDAARAFLFDGARIAAAGEGDEAPLAVAREGVLAEPLAIQDEVIGQLRLLAGEGAFDEDDAALVAAIAEQLSARIENLRLTAETQLALTETAALYRAGTDLNEARTYEEVVDVMREHSVAGRDASAVVLVLYDEPWEGVHQPARYEVAVQWLGFEPEEAVQIPEAILAAAASAIGAEGPVYFADAARDETLPAALRDYLAGPLRGRSALFVPLVAAGQWIGYLATTYPEPAVIAAAELQRLATLAGQASVAIQSISLLEAAQQRAREERILREVATRVRSVTDVDLIMRTAVREIGQALGRETFLYLGDEDAASASGAEHNGQESGLEAN